METVSDFIYWGSKITADGDCSNEIKRRLLLGKGFPGGPEVKASTCNAGDLGSIPGLGRSSGWEDPLEKEMATHSSILAWRIPWTEEPCGLQSTGSQRVEHDWATSLSL